MHKAVLLLGCNLGNKEESLDKALQFLNDGVGKVMVHSAYYKSPPWGFTHHEDFLNVAVIITTAFTPLELLAVLKEIEKKLGRSEPTSHGYEARIMDIDILYFDEIIMASDELHIPHRELEKRRFALAPLAEIAPDWNHPVLHKNSLELLATCTDNSLVTSWNTSL